MVIRFNKLLCWFVFFILLVLCLPFTVISQGSQNEQTSINLPVIMYHHTTTKQNNTGQYTVLLSEFESDIEYIKKCGYTTVTVNDLIDFVNGYKSLPEKSVMITFDDGFESFYRLCFPVLKRENMKAVMAVIGVETEKYSKINDHNINYSNLTWDQINELSESGLVEIANHTYNMHHNQNGERKGMSMLKNETDEQYMETITDDIIKMQILLKQRAGVDSATIAYPYGAYNAKTKQIIKSLGFKCSFTCEEKINTITKNSESLFNLGRYNRPSGISSEDFFSPILKQAESL